LIAVVDADMKCRQLIRIYDAKVRKGYIVGSGETYDFVQKTSKFAAKSWIIKNRVRLDGKVLAHHRLVETYTMRRRPPWLENK
jgi:hypothetical protein